ncbi:acyl-CoA dehydrogenase family protein [Mycobacterium pinniadriaticum]|uniref:Acyl-CoA/acyl-ACP dehydrogenase n=1 Tax=Mycobacterium pinniadriaticum TaxID=2994102 RepID=A0ABT3SFF4_9MYCO|nr:acyl-CoA dehydrogenase family protein [Mycobacterium pinniadriaticum]MCX2938112.1 acyl-CoA/acyl-ACP dehydrogenase [Mycobacterium pinniadriaticum]
MTSPPSDRSETVAAIWEAVQGVSAQWGRAYWRDCRATGRRPSEFMTGLADAGLLGIGVPENMGGSGGGVTELVALAEALGRTGVPLSGYVVVPFFCRVPVIKVGTPAQVEAVVKPTLTGEPSVAFAFTEPDAGTNSFAMRTHAQKIDNGWRLDGQKTYISGADEAPMLMVAARTNSAGKRAELTLFVLPNDTPGISVTPQNITVNAPEKQCTVFFDGVEVPDSAVLGEPGRGAAYLFDGLNPERLVAAGGSIGLGDFVLQKGVEYASERAPFGTPIGAYQSVAHPMARAKVGLEAAKLFAYRGAEVFDSGGDAGQLSNMAKLMASESAWAATDSVIQAFGGAAFDVDNDILWLLETLRLTRVAPLNNEMILNSIGTHLLGLPRSY